MPRHSHPFIFYSQLHAIQYNELIDAAMANIRRVLARYEGAERLGEEAAAVRHRPPDELLMALRSPRKGPRTTLVRCNGHRWRVDVTPSGKACPDQERRIWEAIQAHAREVADGSAVA